VTNPVRQDQRVGTSHASANSSRLLLAGPHGAQMPPLDSGTTVSATAKWLGHDPAMTLRVYGHVYDDALASAGDVLLGGMPRANERR